MGAHALDKASHDPTMSVSDYFGHLSRSYLILDSTRSADGIIDSVRIADHTALHGWHAMVWS